MRPLEETTRNGRPSPTSRTVTVPSELDRLRAACRHQALAIDTLIDAVSIRRTRVAAPKAENGDHRLANDRARARGRGDTPQALEARLALEVHASAAARIVIRAHTRDRDAERVGIHDRHYRRHDAAPSTSGVSGLAASARAAASARGAAR
jgi:hypothetical protein